jgi:hypothetical protein
MARVKGATRESNAWKSSGRVRIPMDSVVAPVAGRDRDLVTSPPLAGLLRSEREAPTVRNEVEHQSLEGSE